MRHIPDAKRRLYGLVASIHQGRSEIPDQGRAAVRYLVRIVTLRCIGKRQGNVGTHGREHRLHHGALILIHICLRVLLSFKEHIDRIGVVEPALLLLHALRLALDGLEHIAVGLRHLVNRLVMRRFLDPGHIAVLNVLERSVRMILLCRFTRFLDLLCKKRYADHRVFYIHAAILVDGGIAADAKAAARHDRNDEDKKNEKFLFVKHDAPPLY